MDTVKALAMPAIIALCPVITIVIMLDYFFIPFGLMIAQLLILGWIIRAKQEEECIKQSKKLWRKIKSWI
jgi:antibiotic biosynthesis monooxygenase (ABM) superfamily enzyme